MSLSPPLASASPVPAGTAGAADPGRRLLDRAVALAGDEGGALAPGEVLQVVRGWGESLRRRVAADVSPANRLRLLNHYFFAELGFSCRACADRDPLRRAIEGRTGLAVSLALLYLDIGAAVRLRLQPVAFPGRLLLKLALAEGTLLVDVAARGATPSARELHRLLATQCGADGPLHPWLRAASEREVLALWLGELRSVPAQAGDWALALAWQNRLVSLVPDSAAARRQRAELLERLGCPLAAAVDLETCLALETAPDERMALRQRCQVLRGLAPRLH